MMNLVILVRALACLILAVILSIDLVYVRAEAASCVVTEILIGRKKQDRIKIVNLHSSEVSFIDVTKDTAKQVQVGERIEIFNSLILFRAVAIKTRHYNIKQSTLFGNILIFVLNILAIVGFIEGLTKFYSSKAH
jgi:hypothetical protein